MNYQHQKVEKKWQTYWKENKTFACDTHDFSKPKFYVLEDVYKRQILNASLSWSEELTRYLFIWSAFISISYCIKKWISIKIDQLINCLLYTSRCV